MKKALLIFAVLTLTTCTKAPLDLFGGWCSFNPLELYNFDGNEFTQSKYPGQSWTYIQRGETISLYPIRNEDFRTWQVIYAGENEIKVVEEMDTLMLLRK